MKKKKSNFIIQGSILAITSILVRIIGIFYRIPLTNMIGTEGIGYYSSAYNIYSVLLLLSSYSLPLAVSKMVSARVSDGRYKNAYRVFQVAFIYAAVVGTLAMFITYFGADFYTSVVLKKPMVSYALKVLAPTILVVALLGVFRGYFQGLGTMIPTALSQVIEQIINAVASIVAAYLLYQEGFKSNLVYGGSEYPSALGAAGGTVGTFIGALSALVFFLFVFSIYRKSLYKRMKKDKTAEQEPLRMVSIDLLSTVLPIIISSVIYNISSVIDDGVFSQCMVSLGSTTNEISNLWGIFSGKYHLLTNVPIAIASALASSMIPSLTSSIAQGDRGQAVEKVGISIRFAMLIAIPSAVGLMVLAGPIMNLLFSGDNALAANMMLYGASAVIFFSLSTITNAILQGINHMMIPIKHAAISLFIHLAALVIMLLVFKMGIYSVVFANIIFAASMCVLNARAISKYLEYRQEYRKTFLLPLLASGIMGILALGTYILCFYLIKNNGISTLLSIIVSVLLYGALLLKLKCVDEVELYQIPKGQSIIKLARKIHLL